MASKYELKLFKKSGAKDLTKAIRIYINNIEPHLRTDTREILYWIDKYSIATEDKFLVFGFYFNDVLVGYAQLAFFKKEKLVFIDYLAIDKQYRGNHTFYEFINEIQQFIIDEGYEYQYAIAEIGLLERNKEPDLHIKTMIRLLKICGFGVIKTAYIHPMLGKSNFESKCESILMIMTQSNSKSIKTETYLFLLQTIYFRHYARWYKPFLDEIEFSDYNKELDILYQNSAQTLKRKKIIEINGYPGISNSGSSNNPGKFNKNTIKNISFLLLFILFAIGFGAIHLLLKNKLGIDSTAQTYIIIVSAIGVLFVLSLVKESKDSSLSVVIEKILKKLID
jgi:hypothetical protein